MSTNSKANESKYFQIAGGSTVLQKDGDKWLRWDVRDGVVPTDLDWTDSDSKLIQISKDEAIALMV